MVPRPHWSSDFSSKFAKAHLSTLAFQVFADTDRHVAGTKPARTRGPSCNSLVAILLHAAEAAIRASVYQTLGALPDSKSAILFSLSAMTTYGHEHFDLANYWQLMGALEAINGMILFGLTTAFL